MAAVAVAADLKLEFSDNHSTGGSRKKVVVFDLQLSDTMMLIRVGVPSTFYLCSVLESRRLLQIWGLALSKEGHFSLLSEMYAYSLTFFALQKYPEI